MTVYTLDPLQDSRWQDLITRHPGGSVFHTTAWLEALQRTYGYRPLVVTTSAPDRPLEDGVALCEVRSWLTGRRLVSLPFADHCEPIVERAESLHAIAAHLDRVQRSGGWKYIELRPHTRRLGSVPQVNTADHFWFHVLDLRPALDTLFAAFHKDSTQRKIQRAHREGLTCAEGRGESLLRAFYELLILTRHRHQLPPQPFAWFRNLAASFGDSMKVRVALHGTRPIAAVVTLRHNETMVYKYGASDARFHSLGAMHLLFWRSIQEARTTGCTALDLGRCDTDNPGLATFKERWGATRSEIVYCRFGATGQRSGTFRRYAASGARQVLDHAPGVCRVAAGRFLYRHAG